MYKETLRKLKDECGISYAKMAEMIGMNASTFRGVMNEEAKSFDSTQIAGIRQMVGRLQEILAELDV